MVLKLKPIQIERLRQLQLSGAWYSNTNHSGQYLSVEKVEKVKKLIADKWTYEQICKECHVSKTLVSMIKKGKYHGRDETIRNKENIK